MAAGRRQIFQLPLQHLKQRECSHITSAHVKKLFSLKLLMQHKAKHVNTTPVCFILLNLTECWQFMYFLVILLNYFIFPIIVFKQHMVPLYRTELDKKRNSCVSSWFDFFFCFIPIKYFLILKKKQHKNFSLFFFSPRKVFSPFLAFAWLLICGCKPSCASVSKVWRLKKAVRTLLQLILLILMVLGVMHRKLSTFKYKPLVNSLSAVGFNRRLSRCANLSQWNQGDLKLFTH